MADRNEVHNAIALQIQLEIDPLRLQVKVDKIFPIPSLVVVLRGKITAPMYLRHYAEVLLFFLA